MNSHKNARLTLEGRKLLIERIAIMGLKPAAQAAGISERTAPWLWASAGCCDINQLRRFQTGVVKWCGGWDM